MAEETLKEKEDRERKEREDEKKRLRRWETIICTSLIVVGLILSLVNGYIPNTPNQKISNILVDIQTQLKDKKPQDFLEKDLKTILDKYPLSATEKQNELLNKIRDLITKFPKDEIIVVLNEYPLSDKIKQEALLNEIANLFENVTREQVLKKLDQLDDLIINTQMTNIFFRHIVGLLAILSGMIGFFWISISKKREDREESEKKERENIRKWEMLRIALQTRQKREILDKIVKGEILGDEGGN